MGVCVCERCMYACVSQGECDMSLYSHHQNTTTIPTYIIYIILIHYIHYTYTLAYIILIHYIYYIYTLYILYLHIIYTINTGLMDALGTTTGPTTHTTTTHTTTTTMGVADSAPPPRPATHDLHELGNTLTGQTIAVAGGGGTGHGGAGGGSGAFAVTTAGVAAGGAGGAVTAGAASGHTALGSVAAGHTAASGFPSGSSRFSAPVPAPGGGQHAALSMPFHLTAPGPSVGRVASTRALTPDAGVVGGGVVGAGVGGHHGGGTGGGGVGAAAVCVGPPHKVHAWLEVQQHGKQQGKEKRVSGLGEKQGDDEPKRSSIPIGAGMMTDSTGAAGMTTKSTGAAGMTTKSTGAGMAKTFLKDLQAALPAALYETVRKAMSSYHKVCVWVSMCWAHKKMIMERICV